MPDETLIASDFRALREKLLNPFKDESVRGASYDIRVGTKVYLPSAAPGRGNDWFAIGDQPLDSTIEIPPGATCIVESLEKVHLPDDMRGRLSLRSHFAKQLLFFAGGVVDPGYDNYLYLPLANLSDAVVNLRYGEPFVSAEFVRLGRDAPKYEPGIVPTDPVPRPEIVFDRVRLVKAVKDHSSRVAKLEDRLAIGEVTLQSSKSVLDLIVLTAVGGGAIALVLQVIPTLQSPWSIVASLVGVVLAVGLIWIVRASPPKR